MLLYLTAFVIGIVVGSFLNVCIYRIPIRKSLIWRSSHCPTCDAGVKIYDNIPLLGYLILRGCCRSCGVPISPQYPIVELVNGLGYALIVRYFGVEGEAIIYALLFSALIVVSFIDFYHHIIPDRITLPGIVIGLICGATILPLGFVSSVLGVLVGGGMLWGVAWLSPYIFGKEGMGGGDIKLLAMIGAFLGWKSTILTIMIGSLVGSVAGTGLILLKFRRREQYLPFGPFLALAAFVSMLYHQQILTWYMNLMVGVR